MIQLASKSIKEWSVEDRPREKLYVNGSRTLTMVELFAILLRSGTRDKSAIDVSRELWALCGNDMTRLINLELEGLTSIKGLGKAKAATILAVVEIAKRYEHRTRSMLAKQKVTCSADAYKVVAPKLEGLKHEEFWVMYMNAQHAVIELKRISSGGIRNTVVDVRLVLKPAILKHATTIILFHNHPSGSLNPSQSDLAITRKICQGAKLLDILVADHIIVSDMGYLSMADEGLMENY